MSNLSAAWLPKFKTVTLSGMSGNSVTTGTSFIPAGSLVLGIATRVLTNVTGPTSFLIGDGTTNNRFGNLIGLAAGTTTTYANWVTLALPVYTAATAVVLTRGSATNFSGGSVKVCVWYVQCTAPSS